ncbi:hypothetical protein Scep_015018 [Stephania cephalantha]|uniref:Uncharacterized protein n=1 Tax=Stephania cephalantha TaxID=152367 RepID=A0AAP0NZZ3_9MAGN
MMDKAECVGGGEDLGEEGMQCSKHPNKSCAGGICGLCLQEKLGKLVSSSKSNSSSFFPISSSSSSASPPTSFTSTTTTTTTTTTTITTTKESSLNRSKSSSATASRRNTRFWSFIHLPVSRRSGRGNKGGGVAIAKPSIHPTPNNNNNNNHNNREEKESPSNSCSSLGRKVGRSRSVGCGSRSMSFSGDFLERLSTGFGDCTVLRRVESHREAPKQDYHHHHHHRHPIKDRVKCGGLFGDLVSHSHHLTRCPPTMPTPTINNNNNNNNDNMVMVMVALVRAGDGILQAQ